MQMFCKHKHEIERLPLLRNLYDHYCQHVTVQTRNRNYQAAAETMKALDFTVSEGGQLFEVMKIQELFDEGLDTQVRTRLANILKASTVDGASLLEREVETKVGDAAYEAEFQKYAGAQSWKERERICRLFLGSDVPSNLSDVSAWRAAVKWMFTDPLLLAGANTYLEKVTSILRTVKPSAAPKTPQARRRQRYVR
jgi:hypothetical protein